MRKLLLTTAAVAAAIAGAVAGETAFGTFTDTRDGQTYKTVKIGKQTWMARNLNYKMPKGSWCYNDSLSYCNRYGRLYDWKTAKTACPSGWHLPSNKEWDDLVSAAGGKDTASVRLKAKTGWGRGRDNGKDGNGTDDFGFSALPGGDGNQGDHSSSGYFYGAGDYGCWWTTTHGGCSFVSWDRCVGVDYAFDLINSDRIAGSSVDRLTKKLGYTAPSTEPKCVCDDAYVRHIDAYINEVMGEYKIKDFGHSVRCVQNVK